MAWALSASSSMKPWNSLSGCSRGWVVSPRSVSSPGAQCAHVGDGGGAGDDEGDEGEAAELVDAAVAGGGGGGFSQYAEPAFDVGATGVVAAPFGASPDSGCASFMAVFGRRCAVGG